MRPGHGRPVLTGLTIAAFAASGATASAVPLDTSSVTDATGVQTPSVSTPQVPQVSVPQVQTPQLPSTPQVPSLPSTPSLPSAPSVPDAGGELLDTAPSLTTPEPVPVVPSTSSAPTEDQATASGDGSGSGAGGADGEAPQTRAAWRANHFEEEVRELRGCLAALSARERQVASMRAGVPFGRPTSRAEVARRLGISTRLVRELERSALNSLRAAARADRCGSGGSASAFAPAPLAMKGSLETVITAQAAGTATVASSGADDAERQEGSAGLPGTNVVASVFEEGPGIAGLSGSLIVENPSVSSVAVGFGVLLLIASGLHVYRRRILA